MSYDVGDVARLSATFSVEGAPVEPDVVRFIYRRHGDEPTTLTYGTDAAVELDPDTKLYFIDLPIIAAGLHYYRWESEGAGQSAEAGTFLVRRNRLAVDDEPPS